MNEHTKALFDKALDQAVPETWTTLSHEQMMKLSSVFAKLLIQKCVAISDDYVKDCMCEEHIRCKHPRSAIGRKIREHFGVEQ